MKLSRKFVSDYIDLDENLTITEIAEAMTGVGNEYDYCGKLIDCTNLTIGEIVECVNHPDSDHLHLCKVDIGSEVLDIVCGAPNARVGIKVIVALDGAKLPGGEIKKGMIRGQVSNGMLCSKAELGLDSKFLEAKDKEGIHELPADAPLGEDPIKYMNLDDEVIDFELTSNRGDLLSILGMAYELGAIYKLPVKDVDTSFNENNEDINDSFKVVVDTEDCSMFLAKKVKNVKICESPDFIKNRLIASGIRSINNVVDISNYVMLETGQPLHFYDAKRLGDTLIVRNATDNEVLTTLDGQERVLTSDDIVIANKNEAVGLAGVMGGLSTEVEEDTTDIIIESAIFDGIKVRKTSKKILRSEASNRFEKGLDPKRTMMAILRSCNLLEEYANGEVVGGIVKYDNTKVNDKVITLKYAKVSKVLGIEIPNDKIVNILNSLGFTTDAKDEEVVVTVPTRRLDVNIVEDLIEEVGRIYGMDNIQGKLPEFKSIPNKKKDVIREIKNKMVDFGLNETLSYTLIPESDVYTFTTDTFERIKLTDPMSEERSTLRYSLIPSLKEVFLYNKARNYKDISIFEIGKSFYKQDGVYKEELRLACLMTGNYYLGINKQKTDFYIIKGIVEELLDFLGYKNRYSFVKDDKISKEFHPGQSASIILQGKNIGVIGKIHPSVLKDDVYVFEINLDKLLVNRGTRMSFKEISKFPSSSKDLAFIVDKNVESQILVNQIKKSGGKILTDVEIFDIYEGDRIDSDKKSIAFNLTFADSTRTLSEEEVMAAFNNVIKDVESKCNAKLRDQ